MAYTVNEIPLGWVRFHTTNPFLTIALARGYARYRELANPDEQAEIRFHSGGWVVDLYMPRPEKE